MITQFPEADSAGHRKRADMVRKSGFFGATKSARERQGSLPSRLVCCRRKWNRLQHLDSGIAGIELDIVSHRACRKQPVHPSCTEELLLDDLIQKRVRLREDLTGLPTVIGVIKDARIDALQSPCVKQRAPVDVLPKLRQRKMVQYTDPGKSGHRNIFIAPLDWGPPPSSFFKRNGTLALAPRVTYGGPRRLQNVSDEGVLTVLAQQACGHWNGTARVEHMNYGLL